MKKYMKKMKILYCFVLNILCGLLLAGIYPVHCLAAFGFFAETTESQTVFSPYLYMEGKNRDELVEEYNDIEYLTNEGMYSVRLLWKDIDTADEYEWRIMHLYYTDIEDSELINYEENVIIYSSAVLINSDNFEDNQVLEWLYDVYSTYDYLDEEDSYISYQWDSVENGNYDIELIKYTSSDNWTIEFETSLNENWGSPDSIAEIINKAESKEEILNIFAFTELFKEPDIQEELNNILDFSLYVSEVSVEKRLSYINGTMNLTNSYGFSATTLSSSLLNCELESHLYIITAHFVGQYLYSDEAGEEWIDYIDDCLAVVGYSDGWKIYAIRFLDDNSPLFWM